MKRKRILVTGAACAFICVVMLAVWPRGPKEPEYQGKKLSEWLEIYDSRRTPAETTATPSEAKTALLAIGTNAVPTAVRWLSYQTPGWKKLVLRGFALARLRMPGFLLRPLYRADYMTQLSVSMFELLGPDAHFASAELERIAARSESAHQLGLRMAAVYFAGGNRLPVVKQTAASQYADVREESIWFLCATYANSQGQALLPLAQTLQCDPNIKVRTAATNLVWTLQQERLR